MEKRITKKADEYTNEFKVNIKDWFEQNNSLVKGDSDLSTFLQFIFDYPSLQITKEDFKKRKRVKNVVLNMKDVMRSEPVVNNVHGEKKMIFNFAVHTVRAPLMVLLN